jgi:hypothetical protein
MKYPCEHLGRQNGNRRDRVAVRASEQGEIEKHYSVYVSIDCEINCGERHGARAGGSYDGSELVREEKDSGLRRHQRT